MRTHNNMTIQDYFRRTGVNTSSAGRERKENPLRGSGDEAFSQLLDAAQNAAISDAATRGLSIRDYAARPVQVRSVSRSFPLGPILTPTPAPESRPQFSNAEHLETEQSISASIMEKHVAAPELENFDEKDQILASIDRAATRYDLPASLIRAVVQAESSYQVRAKSPAGAQGLMQLMPATAKELGVENPYDIDQNIDGGAKYLRNMLDRFNGDIKLALSAYNAGPGAVAKFNGNVPYTETRNYVERVLRYTHQDS